MEVTASCFNKHQSLSVSFSFLKESSLVESPSGDNSSSNMDESSVDPNEDAEVEQKGEVKKEESEQHYGSLAEKEEEEEEEDEEEGEEGDEEEDNEIEMKNEDNNERLEQQEKSREEPNCQSQLTMADKIAGIQTDTHKNDTLLGHEEGSVADQRKKHKVFPFLKFSSQQLYHITIYPIFWL